jgi:D-3-phosphoglycerate dehydrogenase
MTKVLVATVKPFIPQSVEKIKEIASEAGYEFVLLEKYADQGEFIDAVADVDGVIIRSDKATREVIEAAKNLKIIVRAGSGYDNIDLEAATENGVVAMNTPGQNSNAVAELALGMMVYHARNGFNGKAGTELMGKKLGLHGFGYVGKFVSTIAKGFGMDLFAFDPYIPSEVIEGADVVCLETAGELYDICNYVSLNIPANEETKGSIGYDLLSKMPGPAVLVNPARKEIINEDDLLRVYADREDFAYISDIAPDCQDEIAEKYPGRYFFTPKKMGAQTAEANINAGVAAITQIRNFLEDGDTTFQVNK